MGKAANNPKAGPARALPQRTANRLILKPGKIVKRKRKNKLLRKFPSPPRQRQVPKPL